jgi:hypothetical protein
MALALLSDLEKEVHRLSVAGSNLASQDFRLKKSNSSIGKSGKLFSCFQEAASNGFGTN